MKKRTNPLVSVVTVTLNVVHCLEKCIRSIQEQRFKNIEHVIIDGGSTDGTLDIIQRYPHLAGRWISEPDEGIYNAMNKAVKYTRGDWIIFIGADDFLYEGFSAMCDVLEDKSTIYYGQCKWKDVMHSGEFSLNRLTKINLCHQGIFYPKSVFQKYSYNERYRTRADHVLNMQCWNDKEFKKAYYPVLICDYAAGGFSASNPDLRYFKEKPQLIKAHFGLYYYLKYKYRCYRNKRKNCVPDPDLTY